MKANFYKTESGLKPACENAKRAYSRLKTGQWATVDIKRPRNQKFHAKYFVLLNVGFRLWEQEHKDFDRFRKDVIIETGHYDLVFSLQKKEVLKEAKSISFSSMGEDDFSDLYSKSIDIILGLIPQNLDRNYLMNEIEKEVLSFV